MNTMKARFLIAALLAALVVPAVSTAAGPTGQDRENASRACKALRASMGDAIFKQSFGTVQSNRRNAHGRCVSQWSRTERLNRLAAQTACEAEKADPTFADSHGGKSFDQFYGNGRNGANALKRCISLKTRAAAAEAKSKTLNAAKQCKAERTLDAPAFRAKYGKNANDRNAFGKCVSALAKAQNA
jgi:hypothetical protein